MKKYKVRVETPGKLIFFKNRKIRSPFILEVVDTDLELLRSTMTSSAIDNYSIEEIKEKNDNDVWEEVITKEKVVVVEDLYTEQDEEEEPSTILGKLLRDAKNGE